MELLIFFIVVFALIGLLIKHLIKTSKGLKSSKNKIMEEYNVKELLECNNYILIEKDGLVLFNKFKLQNMKIEPIKINKINDIKIYENGQESSAGKAALGGITFGVVGAVVGSAMRTAKVSKMGLKIYSDDGFYDLNVLQNEIKRDSFAYQNATNTIDKIYNVLLKYN